MEAMSDRPAAPYDGLTPDCVLDALGSVGIDGDGRLLALNSYENRVYQVWRDEAPPVVAKFYRPARWSDAEILEEHGFVAELNENEIPAVPALLLAGTTLNAFAGFRFAVYDRHGGRAPELDDRAILTRIGRYVARIHAVGGVSGFEVRPALTLATHGIESRDFLLAHDFLPPELKDVWHGVVDQALDGVRRCFDRAGSVASIRLHGDCHASNVLWTDAGPHFVDFDDARMGPAVQDLWMLLSGDRTAMERQMAAVLDGYEDFRDLDRHELHLVEALRTLRLIHYAAWIARRWDDPAFPAAFPWFNTQRYWQDRILELREQIALMDEPPLVV
jgi:Ser/Thr protein kinase RdoA (MazF antagonist)